MRGKRNQSSTKKFFKSIKKQPFIKFFFNWRKRQQKLKKKWLRQLNKKNTQLKKRFKTLFRKRKHRSKVVFSSYQYRRSKLQKRWLGQIKNLQTVGQTAWKKTQTEARLAWQQFGQLFAKPTAIDSLPASQFEQTFARKVSPLTRTASSYPVQFIFSLLVSASILGGSWSLYWYVIRDLPSVDDLATSPQPVTTRIMDRNGEVLFRIYENENRTLVPLAVVPEHLINATIAIEDQTFYQHFGFSVKGITRAFVGNLKGEQVQGGSTITQQLIKNRLLTSERTIQRKLKELLLSLLVEGSFSKDEILSMYLNEVAYGGIAYGVEEASQLYFGKSVRNLNLAESALLAGLPAAPSVYSPFGPQPELAFARQREVLRRMVEDGYISQEEANQASSTPLQFRDNAIAIKAPHFVMYIKQLLDQRYGEAMVNQGGLEVTTSLDLTLQEEAQGIVTSEVNKLAPLRVSNGAALVTNPQTGEILSMIGSKDYFDFEHDGQVNVTLRPRQPGSSIKPLTYALALEQGRTPTTIINDSPITYQTVGSRPYSPQNYDGKFHGRVTIREALASSYNVPAVKTLAEVGISNVINLGEAMGITTWVDRSRFGLSLTLGGGEVLMTDMAQVYGTFANYGITVPLNPILEIRTADGELLYKNECALDPSICPQQRNLDPRVAYQISDILSDNTARTPAFGPQSVLAIPDQQVAVKTGTTNNLRDNWTIGYTSQRLVAVWVGNNDNSPMSYVASGITGASPIWNEVMRLLLSEDAPHVFPEPTGLIRVTVCEATGTLPCQGCPSVREEYYLPGTQPTQACQPEWFSPEWQLNQPGSGQPRLNQSEFNQTGQQYNFQGQFSSQPQGQAVQPTRREPAQPAQWVPVGEPSSPNRDAILFGTQSAP